MNSELPAIHTTERRLRFQRALDTTVKTLGALGTGSLAIVVSLAEAGERSVHQNVIPDRLSVAVVAGGFAAATILLQSISQSEIDNGRQ